MFRAPLCPSSGAGDYTDIHSMWNITLVMVGRRCGVWLQFMRPGWGMLLSSSRATSLNPDA